jgi:hypothetical protein
VITPTARKFPKDHNTNYATLNDEKVTKYYVPVQIIAPTVYFNGNGHLNNKISFNIDSIPQKRDRIGDLKESVNILRTEPPINFKKERK